MDYIFQRGSIKIVLFGAWLLTVLTSSAGGVGKIHNSVMNAGGINLEKCLASCSGNNYKFGRAVVGMTVMQNLFSTLDFVPEICYHKAIYLQEYKVQPHRVAKLQFILFLESY